MSVPSPLEVFVRAYTEKPGACPVAAKQRSSGDDTPSPWTLIFDCETTVDAAQTLRVGVFQVRKSGELKREGLFYDPAFLGDADVAANEAFAQANQLDAISADDFRKDVFLKIGYLRRGLIVGFNLPFDLSCIAIGHGVARGSMRGGFSFRLTRYKSDPQIRVKHLSARASLIDLAAPAKQETPRGMRKRGIKVAHHRGYVNAGLKPHQTPEQ